MQEQDPQMKVDEEDMVIEGIIIRLTHHHHEMTHTHQISGTIKVCRVEWEMLIRVTIIHQCQHIQIKVIIQMYRTTINLCLLVLLVLTRRPIQQTWVRTTANL